MSIWSRHKFVTPAESIIVMAICFRRGAFLPTTCHTKKLPGQGSTLTSSGSYYVRGQGKKAGERAVQT
jgi:hypothetical protein